MTLRTFTARSMQEALRLVRNELGADASVLHTREIASPLGRWLGGRMIEVTASAELDAPSRLNAVEDLAILEARIPAAELQNYRQSILHDLLVHSQNEPSLVEQLAGESQRSRQDLPAIAALRRGLHRSGVSDRLADCWLERLAAELVCNPDCHPDRASDRLRQIVASDVSVEGPIHLAPGRTNVVALVGPTGVGKTTTLAKLAAHFRLNERRSVALITSDTFRIAAADQLRTYAQIIDLPMEVASTPAEMAIAIERLRDNDLILIDTAGRGPHDAARIQELRAQLTAAQPDTIHLVQSCVADLQSLASASQAFAKAGANRLILTKLDEADRSCNIAERLFATGLPLSYIADGQNVPSDLRPASAGYVADLVIANH